MWTIEAELGPWLEHLHRAVGPFELFDAHTHIGQNDPDGYRQTADELLDNLALAGARGVVFPMHEPDGYAEANDRAVQAAADSGGRLVALCRVNPHDDAVAEARRCLDAGAAGIKLHPRAEQFGMEERAVRDLAALAHEQRVPILIHAGRGIPALGLHTVEYATEFPNARFILAHAGISDLAWLARRLPDHPNVLIDTAWWNPSDLVALFALAPPGNIVWASDSPYGSPMSQAVCSTRCALQAGVSHEALRGVLGGQIERVIAREDLLDLGPAPGPHGGPHLHPAHERIVSHLVATMARAFARVDTSEALALARLACDPEGEDTVGAVSRRVLAALDVYERELAPPRPGRVFPEAARMVHFALVLARTPGAPLPEE